MVRLSIFIFTTFLCTLSFAVTSSSQIELLVVRGNNNYPPYEMMDRKGKLTGVHIELVNAVAKELDIKVSFKSLPWNRAIHFLEQGKADAITYIGKTKIREEFAFFCEGNDISETRNGFFALAEQAASINYHGNLSSLNQYKIGTIQGYSYGKTFDRATFLDKDSGAKDQNTLVKKLASKRFDLAIGNIDTVNFAIKQENLTKKIVLLKHSSPVILQYIAFSKALKHEKLAKKFAKTMSAFKQSPAYITILKKYGISHDE